MIIYSTDSDKTSSVRTYLSPEQNIRHTNKGLILKRQQTRVPDWNAAHIICQFSFSCSSTYISQTDWCIGQRMGVPNCFHGTVNWDCWPLTTDWNYQCVQNLLTYNVYRCPGVRQTALVKYLLEFVDTVFYIVLYLVSFYRQLRCFTCEDWKECLYLAVYIYIYIY